MDAATGTLGAGALIAVIVALIKMAVPGSLPSRVTLAVVAVVAAGVFGLEAMSHMVHGTPYELAAQFISLVAASIGLREGATAIAPSLSELPTNAGPAVVPPPPAA